MKKLMLVLSLLPAVMFADPEEDLRSALDCPNLTFTLGGNANWYVQTDDVHAGTSALRSGPIGDDESTYVETTVTGPSILSFWWNVSSESPEYDYVFASVDDNEITRIGGTAENWTKGEVFVPAGEHKVRWTYLKDVSDEDGEDCAWLDEVSVASAPEKITVHYVVNRGEGTLKLTADKVQFTGREKGRGHRAGVALVVVQELGGEPEHGTVVPVLDGLITQV